jgi:site-specific recombinase XerD
MSRADTEGKVEPHDPVTAPDLEGLEPLAAPTVLAPMPAWPPAGAAVALTGAVATPPRPDQHPALVYLAKLAPGSRRTMRQALDAIAALVTQDQADAASLPWQMLTYAHTAAIRAVLAERHAPATANKMLAALRGTLKEAWRLGLMDVETYRRAADVGSVRGSTVPKGRSLAPGEIRALFTACADDPKPSGVRDAALVAVLYGGGLRRAEVVALDVRHYDAERRDLLVRGKGRKERRVHLQPAARVALDAWLELRTQGLRGVTSGALFLPITKSGRVTLRRMTEQAVWNILEKRRKMAGVAPFSPHDVRRTFIGDLLDAGADISSVQQLAGHANVQTTARYDRRGERVRREAAELLHVPYVGRRRLV